MTKPALAIALLSIAGFAIGFAWGRGTRSALPGATSTTYEGGELVVRVNARQAVHNGLLGAFGVE